jgi:hypothetical protein
MDVKSRKASTQEWRYICCNEYCRYASYSYKDFEAGRKWKPAQEMETLESQGSSPRKHKAGEAHTRKGDQR